MNTSLREEAKARPGETFEAYQARISVRPDLLREVEIQAFMHPQGMLTELIAVKYMASIAVVAQSLGLDTITNEHKSIVGRHIGDLQKIIDNLREEVHTLFKDDSKSAWEETNYIMAGKLIDRIDALAFSVVMQFPEAANRLN